MTVTIEPMATEEREHLLTIITSSYLHGSCYELAWALHEGLGWPLYGLTGPDGYEHAFVGVPEEPETFYDARGQITAADVFGTFARRNNEEIRDITTADLEAVRPVLRHSIDSARKMAEAVWPDLPWQNSHAAQMQAFLEDLERLCRKHGVFLREPYPASAPILYPMDGEEAGFRAQPLGMGDQFALRRSFS